MKRVNEVVFTEAREKHKEKISHLKTKLDQQNPANVEALRSLDLSQLREKWLNSMVEDSTETSDHPSPAKVPVYGKVEPPLDRD